ncbi:ABC transporter permease [Natrarchaeobius oligotrophus]|uniref:FtsX-like permease family protein n=1 Tax=Natrarchaeobius chitinivorans TaxID=1679083 RepID=A0A3N6MND7_NATCH|nr:FtsX-like permease family protein [Natrarchaeobius chitinivorans]RQG97611.1 FtsX-like permease family protein [Natrarchaeobius chitinivorans]
MADESDGSRLTRWRSLVGFSLARLWTLARRTRSGRIAATIVAVALTIALLVIVTGIALGLADGSVTSETDAEVRIGPEDSGTLSAVDGVEGPRIGGANERAEAVRSHEGVDHASPVLVETGRLQAAESDEPRTILLVGVVADDESRTVAGLPTDSIEPGDPHYADGGYDGPPTGEIVLSRAAAERLEVQAGDELEVPGPDGDEAPERSLTVAAVEETDRDSESAAPVALVQLSELQTFAGADDAELASDVLVWGDPAAAESSAADAFPEATAEASGDADPSSLFDDGLAFATSVLALVVGIAICTSFVATTAGMTVNEDRRTLAVLESIGVPTFGRLSVVAISTLTTTLCGALVGAGLGIVGIYAVNAIAAATVASGSVALVHPAFVPYAVVVAFVSAVIAVPYPLAVAARTSVLEEVGR